MTQKTTLSLKLLLPSVPEVQDRCVERLTDLLRAKEGFDMTHLVSGERSAPPVLCIHYAPERLTLAAVRELAQRAGMARGAVWPSGGVDRGHARGASANA